LTQYFVDLEPANGFVAVVDQLYARFDEEEAKLNSAARLYLPELAAWLAATFAQTKVKNWKLPFMSWLDKKYEEVCEPNPLSVFIVPFRASVHVLTFSSCRSSLPTLLTRHTKSATTHTGLSRFSPDSTLKSLEVARATLTGLSTAKCARLCRTVS
jgi:hypothetical protein